MNEDPQTRKAGFLGWLHSLTQPFYSIAGMDISVMTLVPVVGIGAFILWEKIQKQGRKARRKRRGRR